MCLFINGCRKGPIYERPLNFEDQRNADMGKLFGKDLTLFSWEKRSPSSAKQIPSKNFQKVAASLAFLGLSEVNAQEGLIETDWYIVMQTSPIRRIKVRISGLKDENLKDVGASDANFVVLTQERSDAEGAWTFVHTDPLLKDKLVQKIQRGDEGGIL